MNSSLNGARHPLVGRLERIAVLSNEERQALASLPVVIRTFRQDQDLTCDDDTSSQCCIIVEGWVCRYRLLAKGRRQIISFHIAGDMPDLQSLYVPAANDNLAALTSSTVAFLLRKDIQEMIARFPNIAAVLWRGAFAETSICREWIVSMGCRSAFGRAAHLFTETYLRLQAAGLAKDSCCEFPITQGELADALGLSAVHVNRTLQEMRRRGLVTLHGGRLVIHDWAALAKEAEFDPAYLHGGAGLDQDAYLPPRRYG